MLDPETTLMAIEQAAAAGALGGEVALGLVGGELGYRLLKTMAPEPPWTGTGSDAALLENPRLVECFGEGITEAVRGRVVLDFGCGHGVQSVELVRLGAARVIGLDIQAEALRRARERALTAGVAERCTFAETTDEPVDLVLSKDAFEHFADPAGVLRTMARLVGDRGRVMASFGPTWLHPKGGHFFSPFPWAHLLFSDRALLRWRSQFRDDGATRIEEVAGGLNRMTIARFERLVAESPLRIESMDTVPIRGLRVLRHRWLREIGSSLVRCTLVPR
ncbi:MAG: methyltransferase domain-containing protein [Burkholderiales bacterium]|jgi:SAM-dependent methyltransferase